MGFSKARIYMILCSFGLLSFVYVLFSGNDGSRNPHLCTLLPDTSIRSTVLASMTDKQWIIITPSFYTHPQPEMTNIAAIPGWKLLIVGDGPRSKKVPPNSVYLQTAEGDDLLPRSMTTWEWRGCMYALKHGAETIYVPGKDTRPGNITNTFHLKKSMWSLIYTGKTFFNPFRHFGQPNLRPPRFPFLATDAKLSRSYNINHWSSPVLQHGVYNGADAVYNVVDREQYVSGVTFDQNSPSVIVPIGIFSPHIREDTLFKYDAIWALVLQSEDVISLSTTYRTFWIQRLLWEMGGNVGFFPSGSSRVKPSLINPKKTKVVNKNNIYSDKFIKTLTNWRCRSTFTFFECVMESSIHMLLHGCLTQADVTTIQNILQDLKSVGYKEPFRIPFGRLSAGAFVYEDAVLLNQTRFVPQMIRATYEPQIQRVPGEKSATKPASTYLDKFTKVCTNTTLNLSKFVQMPSVKRFPNILLIVVFNFPHYENIPYLETMYRCHFPHILYCGSHMKKYEEDTRGLPPMSFIEVDIGNGWFAQNCLIQAMKMNYNVDGYIYLADDSLLNVWNLDSQPLEKLWIYSNGGPLYKSLKIGWMWFGMPNVGLVTYEKALKAAKFLDVRKFERFHQNLVENTGKPDGFLYGSADIAYVPKSQKDRVLYFMDHFSKFNLFVEIIFTTVFGGLEKWSNIYEMPGKYLWYDGKRAHIEKYFNKSELFLHPVKISKELQTKKGVKFFCETFLPLTLT